MVIQTYSDASCLFKKDLVKCINKYKSYIKEAKTIKICVKFHNTEILEFTVQLN